jgi:hypothetical protein
MKKLQKLPHFDDFGSNFIFIAICSILEDFLAKKKKQHLFINALQFI